MQRDFTFRDLERALYGFLKNNFWGRIQKAKKNKIKIQNNTLRVEILAWKGPGF